MTALFLTGGFILGIMMILGVVELLATRRARIFARRHHLQPVRGSIDRGTSFTGIIWGKPLQIESERRSAPRGQSLSYVAFLADDATSRVALLRRYRDRFLELSLASAPYGMKRVPLSGVLAQHYELWVPTVMESQGILTVLERPEVSRSLTDCWGLREVQWLGGQLVLRLRGDVASLRTMEQAWTALESLLQHD